MADPQASIPAPVAATAAAASATLSRLWPALFTLVVALAITVAIWRVFATDAEMDARVRFERRIDNIVVSIESRLKAYEQVLRGARGLFHVKGNVTREDWRTYVSALRMEDNYRGIQGLGYAAWLTEAQLDEHVRTVRAEGFPAYEVHPAGKRDHYSAIVYIEPFYGRNLRALGYDMYADPVRRAAMDRALSGARTTISGKVTLMQETDTGVQAGFLMYLPVYRKGTAVDTEQDRRAAIAGFVYAPFRADDLIKAATDFASGELHMEIYDGDIDRSAGAGSAARLANLLFSTHADTHGIAVHGPHVIRTINVQDRKWTLKFDSHAYHEVRERKNDAAAVLATGVLMSLLLSGFVLVLLRTRERALRLATQMTFALRESEQRFDLAVQGSAQGVWERRFIGVKDAYFSARFKEMLGVGENDFPERFSAFESRIHPLERGLFLSAMQAHITRRVPLQVDLRVRTHSDGFRWFRVVGQASWDEAGHPVRVAGSILDITERRDAEQALRMSEERLKLALDGGRRALFDWSIETDEIYLSDYWASIIGVPPVPTYTNTQALADVIHPKDAALQQRRIRDTIKGLNARYEVECRVLRHDGSWRWVRIEGVVVQRDAFGRAQRLIGTVGDITERKEEERAKSDFISMVSHELRTPLTSIHGALAMVAGGAAGELDEETRGMLSIAHQNSLRLLRLADDIIDIDRMEAGRMEFRMARHALSSLVAQAVSEVKPYADMLRVTMELDIEARLYVNVDEGRFVQVLTNLLANAAKFSPAGSTINVAITRSGMDARVTVTDQGSGISEDFRRELFQKFTQSPGAQARVLGGAGLGLNIVRTLTEAMGGRAGYYPAAGGGSAFHIDLPEA